MIACGFRVGASGVLSAVGFGLTLAWCVLTSQTIGFTPSTLGVGALVNPRIFYLLGIFLFALAFVAAPRALKQADRALRYILPLLSASGTACYGLAYHQTFLDSTTLAVGGLFVVGMGFFWFLARYVLMIARTQAFACAVGIIASGIVVKLPIVPAFGSFISPEWQVVVAIALPVVSALVFEAACAMARREASRDGAGVDEEGMPSTHTVYGIPVKPRADSPASGTFRRNAFILLFIAGILLAVIRSVSFLGLWGNADAHITPTWFASFAVSAIVLVAFAYAALVRMADFTLTMRFQPAILLILAGLFVVALQADPDSAALPFLTDVIQIDELCAHLLYWTVIITALDALDMPSYRVIGIAEAVFAATSIAWLLLLSTFELVNNVYVLLATYVVVIGAMYATWAEGKRRSSGKDAVQVAPAGRMETCAVSEGAGCAAVGEELRPASEPDAFDGPAGEREGISLTKTVSETCLDLAQRYGLSPRETEVFTLLAQGRTRAFIQDELVLSGSTVKTHVTHIYAKLGVRDRQEMMDLIWN